MAFSESIAYVPWEIWTCSNITFSGFGSDGGLIAGGGGLELLPAGPDFFITEGFSVADGHPASFGFNVAAFFDDDDAGNDGGICLPLALIGDSFEAIFITETGESIEIIISMDYQLTYSRCTNDGSNDVLAFMLLLPA